jgi:hypothetical protein
LIKYSCIGQSGGGFCSISGTIIERQWRTVLQPNSILRLGISRRVRRRRRSLHDEEV